MLWPPAQSSREKSRGGGQWSPVAVWQGTLPLTALSLRLSVVTAGVSQVLWGPSRDCEGLCLESVFHLVEEDLWALRGSIFQDHLRCSRV